VPTVDDTEPKYGMAVSGIVHPCRILRNSTAQVDDVLILTKPLGMGIIATALKRGLADKATAQKVIAIMSTLNKAAAEAMETVSVHACTDITGFGLLGHLHELASGSQVDVELTLAGIPILPEARALASADIIPGGTLNNLSYVQPFVTFAEGISRVDQVLLADAQTSGGLLISLAEDELAELLHQLEQKGVSGKVIGCVISKGTGLIRVSH
jgi:selenide,water dikinase